MSFRLSNYLKLVLECQGESLVLLAGLLGEERTLRVLEDRDDESDSTEIDGELRTAFERAVEETRARPDFGEDVDAYEDLETAMNKIHRFPHFQFYLWSYPGYRKWVESEFALDERVNPSETLLEKLADDALAEFHAWYASLKIPAAIEASSLEVISRPYKKLKHDLFRQAKLSPFRVIGS